MRSRLRSSRRSAPLAFCTPLAVCLALSTGLSCSRPAESPGGTTVRLLPHFSTGDGATQAVAAAPIARSEWRFDSPPAPPTGGSAVAPVWKAGLDVAGLEIRDGRLTGRSTGSFPVLHLERTSGLDNPDQLHAVEVRLRVSAGANLWLHTSPTETVDLASLQRTGVRGAWRLSTPIQAGEELRTYTVIPGVPMQGSQLRHLLIRPTDAENASFAIESVRLVFRKEHLDAIPAGVSWQGLRDVFRETLVARAPESAHFSVRLPDRPWLDLAVGTIEDAPMTFKVRVAPAAAGESTAGARAIETRLTVTTPYRWEPLTVDLEALAGDEVTMSLELVAEAPGGLGFWGAPVVRDRRQLAVTRSGSRGTERPRGVILIQADTLRRDHLEVYGHDRPTAPVIAGMARAGVLFRNAISQASWTKVSTPSILASLYPSTHGVRSFHDRLPASATTVAESYRDAGYATVAFCSNPFVGQYTNLHQGFEELHEAGSLPNRTGPLTSKTAREHVGRLLFWLERHREAPFFVFLHVFDPHSPYEPYAPWSKLWVDAKTRQEHALRRTAAMPLIADEFMKVRQLPSRAELLRAKLDPDAYVAVERAWYDASIRAMDVELGRLLERLATWGLDEETLIVLASDHGTEFLEHGEFFHGHSLYGELTNVPLVVRWPQGVAAGRVVDELVQNIDIVPTLLEASGLAPAPELQGQSLATFLDPDRQPAADGSWPGWRRRPAFSQSLPSSSTALPPRDRSSYSIVEGDWKLIQNLPPATPSFELFDWRQDPLNRQDVAAGHPEVVATLAETLRRWREKAEAAKLPADADLAKNLQPEELERLRSLGYLR